jgi:hypothetical protein
MTDLSSNRKLFMLKRASFHISAIVTFDTNIWTNHWMRSVPCPSSFRNFATPSPDIGNLELGSLGDQQAKDAGLK